MKSVKFILLRHRPESLTGGAVLWRRSSPLY